MYKPIKSKFSTFELLAFFLLKKVVLRVELTVYFTTIFLEFRVKFKLLIKNTIFQFPAKIHQLVAMSFPTCNQKFKWDSMYLIFLHIMNKFHGSIITFKGPTTSIIAFGGKMKQLFHYWQQ